MDVSVGVNCATWVVTWSVILVPTLNKDAECDGDCDCDCEGDGDDLDRFAVAPC